MIITITILKCLPSRTDTFLVLTATIQERFCYKDFLLQRSYYKGGVGRLNSFSKIVFQVGESIYILSCILSLKAWPYSSRSNLSRANNPVSILMGPGSRNFESESHTVVSTLCDPMDCPWNEGWDGEGGGKGVQDGEYM